MDLVFFILMLLVIILISIIGIRMLTYWYSFLFHWKRQRLREHITTEMLKGLKDIPNIKVQITTRGSAGSTEVILRGIRNIQELCDSAPQFYHQLISVELVTESDDQAKLITNAYRRSGLSVDALVIPKNYETPKSTKLKARGLHYAVEERRNGWNQRSGRTFIIHYDEESVILPEELRKLMSFLTKTDKKILEGPIYYPLEYMNTSMLCRSMEANRPVGCFECRQVMEKGVPIHLHGSNLVIEEALENEIGWDLGNIDGQPFIAEDYVFGMNVFVEYGKEVFGWHGCVMLEQPPFSVKSAFKQRHRWVFGVLQGMKMVRQLDSFKGLPKVVKAEVILGTKYRITSFALGSIVGVLAFLLLPFLLPKVYEAVIFEFPTPLYWVLSLWLAIVGFMWIGSIIIGAWYNVHHAGLQAFERLREIMKAVTVAPVAGLIESSAGFWAVFEWNIGRRQVFWNPTPKTIEADASSNKTKAEATK